MALQEGDADALDRTAGAIRGRSARICSVVDSEMQNYEAGVYVVKVSDAVLILREQGEFRCVFILFVILLYLLMEYKSPADSIKLKTPAFHYIYCTNILEYGLTLILDDVFLYSDQYCNNQI